MCDIQRLQMIVKEQYQRIINITHIKFNNLQQLTLEFTHSIILQSLTWMDCPNLLKLTISLKDQQFHTPLKDLSKLNFSNLKKLEQILIKSVYRWKYIVKQIQSKKRSELDQNKIKFENYLYEEGAHQQKFFYSLVKAETSQLMFVYTQPWVCQYTAALIPFKRKQNQKDEQEEQEEQDQQQEQIQQQEIQDQQPNQQQIIG